MRAIRYFFYWTPFVLAVSVLAGSSSFLFLNSLEKVSSHFFASPEIIWGLPFVALLTLFVYKNYGGESQKGANLIYSELDKKSGRIPARSALLVFLFSLLSHLFGASVGREGVGVQMSTALTDQLQRVLTLKSENRKTLLLMALAAGFSSIFGTPWAGFIFAFESPRSERPFVKSLIPIVAASFGAHHFALFLGIEHAFYSAGPWEEFNFTLAGKVLLLGLSCGLTARLYTHTQHHLKTWLVPQLTYVRAFVLSCTICVLTHFLSTEYYNGLGLNIINSSFLEVQEAKVFLTKSLFTILSNLAGLKGGEVTPLFAIGASFGSFTSEFLNLPIGLAAAVGFVAIFAGCVHAPWTCAIMGAELFGSQFILFFILACLISNKFSGQKSIYSIQNIAPKGWLR